MNPEDTRLITDVVAAHGTVEKMQREVDAMAAKLKSAKSRLTDAKRGLRTRQRIAGKRHGPAVEGMVKKYIENQVKGRTAAVAAMKTALAAIDTSDKAISKQEFDAAMKVLGRCGADRPITDYVNLLETWGAAQCGNENCVKHGITLCHGYYHCNACQAEVSWTISKKEWKQRGYGYDHPGDAIDRQTWDKTEGFMATTKEVERIVDKAYPIRD